MFAIIETGGKQYKVEKGTTLTVEKINEKEGSSFKISKVLLLEEKGKTQIGMPLVAGAEVTAKVVKHQRGEKITVFKMKPKKRYQKTQGHRQEETVLEITDIKQGAAKKAAAKKEDVKEEAKEA